MGAAFHGNRTQASECCPARRRHRVGSLRGVLLLLRPDERLAGTALTDSFVRRKMKKEGKLSSVEAIIDAKGEAMNVTVRDKSLGGPPVSDSSTENVFEPKTTDGSTISGRIFRKSPGASFDDVPFTYDATFSAPVAPRAKK